MTWLNDQQYYLLSEYYYKMINRTKYINQFFLLIIASFFISACIPLSTQLTPKVTGGVFDSRTKAPIANAYIHNPDSSRSSYSSSTGAYELDPINGEKLVGIFAYNNQEVVEDVNAIIVDAQGYRQHVEKIIYSQQSKRVITKDIYLTPEIIPKKQVRKTTSTESALHCPAIQDIKLEKTIYKGKYRLTATTAYNGTNTKWIGENLYDDSNLKVERFISESHAACNDGICNTTCNYRMIFANSYSFGVLLKNL